MKIDIDIKCPYCGKVHDTTIYMNARDMTCFEDWGGCGKTFPIKFKTSKITVVTEKNRELCDICMTSWEDDLLSFDGEHNIHICPNCIIKGLD